MAASALEKNVATFCSVAVGGSPPTYTRRACRVACCEGAASAPAEHRVTPAQLQLALRASEFRQCRARLMTGQADKQADWTFRQPASGQALLLLWGVDM